VTPRRRVAVVAVGVVAVGGVVAALLEWYPMAVACVVLLAAAGVAAAMPAQRVTVRSDSSDAEAAAAELARHLEEVTSSVRELSARVESSTRIVARSNGKNGVGELLTEIQALDQLRDRYSPRARLPVIGGWALAPTGLMWLVDAVESRAPRTVVECGSGTSTLWIALALRAVGGGRVHALEHKPEFAELTRRFLHEHGLDDWAEVVDAPLVEQDTPQGVKPWYDIGRAEIGTIDMLVVDGPPSNTGPHARYPALALLEDRLSEEAWILVDDTNRPSERQTLDLWKRERPDLAVVERVGSGSTILRLGHAQLGTGQRVSPTVESSHGVNGHLPMG
jgi:predicted O-methyltransferase YrrM